MKKYDAVIAGYVCVDLIPAFKKNISVTDVYDVLKPGKLVEIDGMESTLGGVVANTGMAMSFEEAGYPYRFMKSTTQHGPTKWHIFDFPAAMRWMWKGYTLPQ
jgi:hypothetical protein